MVMREDVGEYVAPVKYMDTDPDTTELHMRWLFLSCIRRVRKQKA